MTKILSSVEFVGEQLNTKFNYKYFPKTKDELIDIINQRINEEGYGVDLNDIDTSNITDMSYLMPEGFHGDVSEWDVSNVTRMVGMFKYCKEFNCDISNWDVSRVENMEFMFYKCKKFNQNLSIWNVLNVREFTNFAYGTLIENTNKMPKFKDI